MKAAKSFKEGDAVRVLDNLTNWQKEYAPPEYTTVNRVDIDNLSVDIIWKGKPHVLWCDYDQVEHSEIYNSPLYQALK